MLKHIWKFLEPAGAPTNSIVDAVEKSIMRSRKTLEGCVGFRASKRAEALAKERINLGR